MDFTSISRHRGVTLKIEFQNGLQEWVRQQILGKSENSIALRSHLKCAK